MKSPLIARFAGYSKNISPLLQKLIYFTYSFSHKKLQKFHKCTFKLPEKFITTEFK